MEEVLLTAVTFDRNQVKLSVVDLPDIPGIAAKMFGALAVGGINVDMIIQSAAQDKRNDISFTVSRSDLKKTQKVLGKIRKDLKAANIIYDKDVAKVSIIGVGMKSHPGVAATMFTVLADNKINIEMISTSEIKISCIIDNAAVNKAVTALHAAFGLNKRQ